MGRHRQHQFAKRKTTQPARKGIETSQYSRPFPQPQPIQAQTDNPATAEPLAHSQAWNLLECLDSEPMTHATPVLPKLMVGAVDDPYEQEADAVAAQVVQQLNNPEPAPLQREAQEEENLLQMHQGMPPVQLITNYEDSPSYVDLLQAPPSMPQVQCTEGYEDEKEEIRRSPLVQLKGASSGETASPELEQSIQQERGKGHPLANRVRQPMENAFGSNFGGVRIHTDNTADLLNQHIQAKAFTTGQDVFFRQGAYAPNSQGGQELLAHELTHVVQQNEIQRTVNLPPADLSLEHHDGRAVQRKSGSVTPELQRFGEDSQGSDALTELTNEAYPLINPEPLRTAPSPSMVVQRAWDTHLINYDTMAQEKQKGEIRTGKWKMGSSTTKLVAQFKTELMKKDEKNTLKALTSLLARLETDQKAAAKGDLKAPKDVKSKNFDKEAAQASAAEFFYKWIQSVQAHIDHAQRGGDWLNDFRQTYISDAQAAPMTPKEQALGAQAAPMTPKEQVLANVKNLENADSSDVEAVEMMWDKGDAKQQQRMTDVMGGVTDMPRMTRVEYFLEQASPVHIGGKQMLNLFEFWKEGVLYRDMDWAWQDWMPNNLKRAAEKSKDRAIVDSYDAAERAQYQLTPQGKKINKADGQPLVGNNIYVLTKDDEWYGSSPKDGSVHHSSFMQGAPVKCAGHLHTDNQGNLQKIDINTGHYKASKADLKRAMAVLSTQMDISEVETGTF